MANSTANDIIVGAFNLIAVASPDDVLSARNLNVGLDNLNDILAFFSSDGQEIPFRTKFSFTLQSGKNAYTFSQNGSADINMPPIIELSECNITFNNVILPCNVVPYSNIVNTSRVSDLNAIPGTVYLQRQAEYSELFFYPAPTALINLGATIYAKFALGTLILFEDVVQVPDYYVRFLKYELARVLASIYPSATWSDSSEATYQAIVKKIKTVTDIDVCIQGDALLTRLNSSTSQSLLGMLPVAGS